MSRQKIRTGIKSQQLVFLHNAAGCRIIVYLGDPAFHGSVNLIDSRFISGDPAGDLEQVPIGSFPDLSQFNAHHLLLCRSYPDQPRCHVFIFIVAVARQLIIYSFCLAYGLGLNLARRTLIIGEITGGKGRGDDGGNRRRDQKFTQNGFHYFT